MSRVCFYQWIFTGSLHDVYGSSRRLPWFHHPLLGKIICEYTRIVLFARFGSGVRNASSCPPLLPEEA